MRWCQCQRGNRKQNKEWGGVGVALGSLQVRAGSWLGRGRRRGVSAKALRAVFVDMLLGQVHLNQLNQLGLQR